jgi:hypothetical protein
VGAGIAANIVGRVSLSVHEIFASWFQSFKVSRFQGLLKPLRLQNLCDLSDFSFPEFRRAGISRRRLLATLTGEDNRTG